MMLLHDALLIAVGGDGMLLCDHVFLFPTVCRRSVTILPAALSPHSLASVPSASFGGASFTFSVPPNLSQGSGLGGNYAPGVDFDEGPYSASEASESEPDSRDPSQHGASSARRGG